MSVDNYNFVGWLAHDKTAAHGTMKWEEFEPKPWSEDDVDIEVECCGICASDLHTLRSGWGPTPCMFIHYHHQHHRDILAD